jgi:uncharacterized protein YktB (UPF0637 family)
MTASEWLRSLDENSVSDKLKFVKKNAELRSIVLQDADKTYAVSIDHVKEMGDAISVVNEDDNVYLVAKWRKVKEGSFWVRCDSAKTRKLTLADIMG